MNVSPRGGWMSAASAGGGAQSLSAADFRLPGHGRGRYAGLLCAGLTAAGLAAFSSVPMTAVAQTAATDCKSLLSSAAGSTSVAIDGGDLPDLSYGGTYKKVLDCDGLNLSTGLTLTLESGGKIGTATSPIIDDGGIYIDEDNGPGSAGEKAVTVVNNGEIHAQQTRSWLVAGIYLERKGEGLAKVHHKAGKIVAVRESGVNNLQTGIYVWHKGKAGKTDGIQVISSADIDLSKSSHVSPAGIWVTTKSPAAGSEIPIVIDITGGTILASGSSNSSGVYIDHHTDGDITVDAAEGVKLGTRTAVIGGSGIQIGDTDKEISGRSDVTITNNGEIHANGYGYVNAGGISVTHKGTGTVTVKHGSGGKIFTGGASPRDNESGGIRVLYEGVTLDSDDKDGKPRAVVIESSGMIDSGSFGVYVKVYGDDDKSIPVTVDVKGGVIDAVWDGIYVMNGFTSAGGVIKVKVDEGAEVKSRRDGVHVDGALLKDGTRAQTVEVHGTVAGGGEGFAGVHMVKGGTVVIGPRAHVSAASGTAVKANAEGDMTVILVMDGDGFTGTVVGEIRNAAETVFRIRDASGAETALTAGRALKSAGETKGVYRAVRTSVLEELEEGYKFKPTGAEERQYHARARVYEVLPSALLDLNAPAPRLPRGASDGNNVWAAFDGGEGERQAAGSTTSEGTAGRALAWDFTRWGVASGFDFPAGEDLTVGVSAHHRRGKATVKHGGTVKASGTGAGASLTYGSADAVYVRGWFSYSKFSGIELMSSDDMPGSGNLSRSDVSGSGHALGVEAGMRTELEGMTLTPRGGLVFSSVKVDEFSDLEGVAGSGKVSGSGRSLKARLGVTAEIGEVAAGAAVYASLDVEHEFSSDRGMTASGTKLASEPKATWGRLGLGGELSLSEDGGTMLSGEAYYATAGGGNSEFGGGLTLGFRF